MGQALIWPGRGLRLVSSSDRDRAVLLLLALPGCRARWCHGVWCRCLGCWKKPIGGRFEDLAISSELRPTSAAMKPPSGPLVVL